MCENCLEYFIDDGDELLCGKFFCVRLADITN